MIAEIAETALRMRRKSESEIAAALSPFDGVVATSIRKTGNSIVMLVGNGEILLVAADYEKTMPSGFGGEKIALGNGACAVAGPCNAANAYALRRCFRWLNPVPPAAGKPWKGVSGFGDLTSGVLPVFGMRADDAGRNATAAVFAALACGYDGLFAVGALAEPGGIGHVLSAGATFVTLDARRELPASSIDEALWCNRVFVLDAHHSVRFGMNPATQNLIGVVDATVEARRELRSGCAALELLTGPLDEHGALYLLRELARRNAALDALAADFTGDPATIELIATVYGGGCRLTGLES